MILSTATSPQLDAWTMPNGVQQPGLYYRMMRLGCQAVAAAMFNVRMHGRQREPASGGVVLVSNHQSFLDPMLITLGLQRPGNYMARDSLFRQPAFSKLIQSVNAFPIRRGSADTAALKEAMRRLKKDAMVCLFPEGTRTRDGRIGRFLPGVSVLSQRAAEWTWPVVIDGAFEAWPRDRALPRPAPIRMLYGEPIHRDEAKAHSGEDFAALLHDRMVEMHRQLREHYHQPELY
jgi:1-acyl-sn-glycerol-3-phosphate acyltransferase